MGIARLFRVSGYRGLAWAWLSLAPISGLPAFGAADAMDQAAIHHAYNEGDFDAVIRLTEPFSNGKGGFSRADSVFVFKHLAVVYTADPKTREKGKFFMYRLLEMLPSAELVDMFVSDEVDRIFDKVRKDFKMRQQNFGVDTALISLPGKAPAAAAPVSASAPAPSPAAAEEKEPDPLWYWIAGGAVVAGAGIAAILLMQPDEAEGKTYVISGD